MPMARAKEIGKVGGLIPLLVDGGVFVLQYPDDTIIFTVHDMEKEKNMKLIMCLVSKLISTRVSSSALERPKKKRTSISNSLVASLVHSHSVTLVCQCIIASF